MKCRYFDHGLHKLTIFMSGDKKVNEMMLFYLVLPDLSIFKMCEKKQKLSKTGF